MAPRYLLCTLLLVAGSARADGDCPRRPLTGAEKSWTTAAAAAAKQALPPAPAGWVAIDPADLDYNYSNTRVATTPADTCADGVYSLEVQAAAWFTPKDSALARRAAVGRKRAALNRQQAGLQRGIGADNQVAGAQAGAGTNEMMAAQQELMAAQASGDGARMQQAMERLQRAGEAMTASTQQAGDRGAANLEKSATLQQQQMELDREFENLAPAAAQSRVVMVAATINPHQLRARGETARALKVAGADASWIERDQQTCFADACGEGGAIGVAVFGTLAAETDAFAVTRYEPKAPITTPAAQRSAMLLVEGDAAMVEPLLTAARAGAINR